MSRTCRCFKCRTCQGPFSDADRSIQSPGIVPYYYCQTSTFIKCSQEFGLCRLRADGFSRSSRFSSFSSSFAFLFVFLLSFSLLPFSLRSAFFLVFLSSSSPSSFSPSLLPSFASPSSSALSPSALSPTSSPSSFPSSFFSCLSFFLPVFSLFRLFSWCVVFPSFFLPFSCSCLLFFSCCCCLVVWNDEPCCTV